MSFKRTPTLGTKINPDHLVQLLKQLSDHKTASLSLRDSQFFLWLWIWKRIMVL